MLKYFLKNIFKVIIIVFVLFICACGNNNNDDNNKEINPLDYKKDLENVNKKLNKSEKEDIQAYISRYAWNMNTTGTGLKYLIYYKGNGKKVKKNNIVLIKFTVNLLNSIVCYSSETDGNKEFILGKSTEISGLEEGLLLMKEGDKAKLIVPSHLAYGLLGDNDKIPMRATLVYDVEVLKVREIK
ncbi:MAG: peptidylprolyl isomerase [Bacteroidetes bacterium HGW-Bacteroidetes-15]|nr:MAG: peptidylprolyl isomerase [Bacteroidetes bacterium HGW-Bacteroidetes-15]